MSNFYEQPQRQPALGFDSDFPSHPANRSEGLPTAELAVTSTESHTVFRFGTAEVRTLTDAAGEPWFIAADVCRVLDLGNPTEALRGLDDDEKTTLSNTEGHSGQRGGAQRFNIVSEPGLYSLVLRSRKPEAKAFRRWIIHEVVPTIRKTGKYAVSMPATFADALRAYALEVEARERLQIENATLKPKAEFFDQVASSNDSFAMNETAKLLGWGQIKMMRRLRGLGILRANNTPFQTYLDRGYFKVVESTWEAPNGTSHVSLSTRVFQRGVDYLRTKLANPAHAET